MIFVQGKSDVTS